MTLCIAAIAQCGTIVCASDRMKTKADITFEASNKSGSLGKHMAIMTAGDALFQYEITRNLEKDIINQQEKNNTWTVKSMVDKYLEHQKLIILEKLNNKVYSKWRLDYETFLAIQNQLARELLEDIILEVKNYYLYNQNFDTATIIAGIDQNGPQIYTVIGDDVSNHSQMGYAAIGSGERHADGYFQQQKHIIEYYDFSKLLLHVYAAKKTAEIAPGVGITTDMFQIHPKLEFPRVIYETTMKELEKNYRNMVKDKNRSYYKAEKNIAKHIEEFTNNSK